MGSTDNYLSVMIESLEKKIAILTEIVEKNTEQNGILSSDELDTEAMQNNMDEKQSLIEQLNQLDEGFNIVFARIKQELEQNRSDYKVEIETMKQRIIQVTDLSMKIQTAEAYNKALAQKRFGIIKKDIQTARRSGKMASTYYQSMNKMDAGPQFMDSKK